MHCIHTGRVTDCNLDVSSTTITALIVTSKIAQMKGTNNFTYDITNFNDSNSNTVDNHNSFTVKNLISLYTLFHELQGKQKYKIKWCKY